jgi:hypothetical protein
MPANEKREAKIKTKNAIKSARLRFIKGYSSKEMDEEGAESQYTLSLPLTVFEM